MDIAEAVLLVLLLMIIGVFVYVGYAIWKGKSELCSSFLFDFLPVLKRLMCGTEHGAGTPCKTPSGTPWPASGCDVTAGICCGPPGQAVCSTTCGEAGQPCYTPNGTWWPMSGCDITAGICCNGKCSTSCNN